MNDLISRQEAIKAIDDLPNCYNGYIDTYDKDCIIGVLEELPTIDAVPVVRCADCKWLGLSEYNTSGIHVCKKFRGVRFESDYCSRAERSE